eukprot:jgi/Mesen1/5811/ME000293S04961
MSCVGLIWPTTRSVRCHLNSQYILGCRLSNSSSKFRTFVVVAPTLCLIRAKAANSAVKEEISGALSGVAALGTSFSTERTLFEAAGVEAEMAATTAAGVQASNTGAETTPIEATGATVVGPASEGTVADRCGFWLPKKRRFCSNHPKPGEKFCGNHLESVKRVPCPIDPTHTIFEKDVASHIKCCPAITRQVALSQQPYFRQGVNAGSLATDPGRGQSQPTTRRSSTPASDSSLPTPPSTVCKTRTLESSDTSCDCGRTSGGGAETLGLEPEPGKREKVGLLSEAQFQDLVRRIEGTYAAHAAQPSDEAILRPPECERYFGPERDRSAPFDERHALQQASILGNLQGAGLLRPGGNEHAFVEFGAGRGYLSHMLCDCYGAERLVMVDRRSYKFKVAGGRWLSLSAGWLTPTVADLDLSGVAALQGREFVAMSKHLCGPATDLTLRCCVLTPGQSGEPRGGVPAAAPRSDASAAQQKSGHTRRQTEQGKDESEGEGEGEGEGEVEGQREGAAEGRREQDPPLLEPAAHPPERPRLKGFGIATCCHHLCSWDDYVGEWDCSPARQPVPPPPREESLSG